MNIAKKRTEHENETKNNLWNINNLSPVNDTSRPSHRQHDHQVTSIEIQQSTPPTNVQHHNDDADIEFNMDRQLDHEKIDFSQQARDFDQNTSNEVHNENDQLTPSPNLRRSNRARKPTWKVQDNTERGLKSYTSTYYDVMHEDDYSIQNDLQNPIS